MRAILSCGGTGGHIYPAIAIADKIKENEPDAEILFIGTKKGMENRIVPDAGYRIEGIDASGFNRKNIMANVETLRNLREGSKEAYEIIKEFKPDVVIGTGGYVTGTVLTVAHRSSVPCFIHEQNAIPGMANRLISEYANGVFISFEGTGKGFRHQNRVFYTGNPVRSDFASLNRTECRKKLGIADDETMVLATGGSLGAAVLNREIVQLVNELTLPEVKVYFVSGKRYYDDIKAQCEGKRVTLIDYADNMPELILASDLVISRAGAIAVSEITASARASVLIPSPNVTNNHQYHNAKAIADAGAAVLLEEKDMSSEYGELAAVVLDLVKDGDRRRTMAECAKQIGRSNAADVIYENLKD